MTLANPYLSRTAIREDRNFIGRRRELATIYSRIGAGEPQSVSVVGERRIGKSSLLRALWRRRREHLPKSDDYVFVYVDLQEMMHGEVATFFAALLQGTSEALADETIAQLAPTYESVRKMVAGLARTRSTLVLLLDEFDAVTRNAAFGLDFFSFLRSLPNNYTVSFVVTSARELQEICHSKEVAGSPFFNIFHKLNLVCFPSEEALEVIVQPSELAGCPLAPHAPDIVQLAGRFPMFLQTACCVYWEFLQDHPTEPADREWIKRRFCEEANSHFAYMWEHLTERERAVCRKLCQGESLAAVDESFARLLSYRGYIEMVHGIPRLFSSAFAEYLQTRLEPQSQRVQDLTGSAIGRFEVRRKLGSGGMGEVFLAKDTKLKRLVALKRLLPHRFADPTLRQRLLKEAERSSQLTDPNIATLYDVFEQNGVIYLVMEYVEGRSLRERMREALSLPEVLDIGEQVCSALNKAHAKGVVHCDIKPENILLTLAGQVKVLDFGVAQRIGKPGATESTITLDMVLGCTPEYAAPEVLQHGEPDRRSDIFSLGVVLYEVIAGCNPFRSPTRLETASKILRFDPRPLTELNQLIPVELDAIVRRCLAKHAMDRYQETQKLLSDLHLMRSSSFLNRNATVG
jgi:serine/threonine-protein kinase